jgi:hypothetical protein
MISIRDESTRESVGSMYRLSGRRYRFSYQLLYISLDREGADSRSIPLDQTSLTVDEELGEVPLDTATPWPTFFTLEISEERMSIPTIDIQFRKKWESHSEVDLTDLLDGLVGLRLLAQELITRKAEHHEVIVRIGIPEGFEFLELWSESTLGCSVDYEEDFSSVLREGYLFMIGFLYSNVVDGGIHR